MGSLKHAADFLAMEQGRRLIAARKERDWTQEDLAKATGWNANKSAQEQPNALSPSRIANYEQGARRLSPEVAAVLERTFTLPAAYWMASVTKSEAEILQTWRRQHAAG